MTRQIVDDFYLTERQYEWVANLDKVQNRLRRILLKRMVDERAVAVSAFWFRTDKVSHGAFVSGYVEVEEICDVN